MRSTNIIVACLVFLLACICVAILAIGVFLVAFRASSNGGTPIEITIPTPQPFEPGTPSGDPVDNGTLQLLADTIVPENDPADLAGRLGGVDIAIPETVPPPAVPLTAGAVQTFWAFDNDRDENYTVEATLAYVTPHVYFWHESNRSYDPNDIRALVEDFENHVYPTVREFFGSEWSPGIDGDEHIYILYISGMGNSVAGYFSSADEMHPLAHEYSNAHEMFFLNADLLRLSSFSTYGTLAHEFQHMIHWNRDRNETTWMNEGFSELAGLLAGYYEPGFDTSYTSDPDIQLNTWPENDDRVPHYGGAFLFLTYFLERFGDTATQDLVARPENGFPSIDLVLAEHAGTDPLLGRVPNGDDLFQDFSLAIYLNDPSIGDGRFAYTLIDGMPQPGATETVSSCPSGEQGRDVSQFGIDYIRITCPGSYTLHFTGAAAAPVVPADPYSGDFAFWSNRGDSSDMTLTRSFDLRGQQGPLTLEYWTWYEIEEGYDYVYLTASVDGEHWEILPTPGGTADDPSGNSYGWGYTGRSIFWIQEQVDISRFAGQQVQFRFEYITDAAVNTEGLLLDDIRIPQIGYFSDFEADDGGWQAEGFVRIHNRLPQTYRLALITRSDGEVRVEYIETDSANRAEIPLRIGGSSADAVLVISGTTRFSRQRAGYAFEITPP